MRGSLSKAEGGIVAADRITITEVAKLANTSTATVSHYLNGKFEKMSASTRESIRRTIEQTGYVPGIQARSLAGKPTGIIAVLILDNTNLWAGQICSGIEGVATSAGFQTVVCNSNFSATREKSYVEKMLSLGVDGFIIQPTTHFRDINMRITSAGKPVVFYDCDTFDFRTSWVKSNLYNGMYAAITECIDRGYERFVFAGSNVDNRSRQERFSGFSDAVSARDLTYETVTIGHVAPSADELAKWFMLHLNTARRTLVCVPNQWALDRVYQALMRQRQLVPDRVGLLGMNNANWAHLTSPSISTIVEPVYEEGVLACQMLLDMMSERTASARQEILDCTTRWLETTR